MRRSVLRPGLTLVLALDLSGSETALAQDPEPQVVRGRSVRPTRTGVVDLTPSPPLHVGSLNGVIYAAQVP